tara:strand:- start:6 stop:224 length:219 start_codon:yes stop_codon:yes gene_type:complete
VRKREPCIHEDCEGSVPTPMVVCPNCGRCQTKKCFETDQRIKEWIKEEVKKPRKPPKIMNQGYGGSSHFNEH